MNKDELIALLIKDGYLKTSAVIEAFNQIDRKDFVTQELKDRAYENSALPLMAGQTISQPLMVVFMLELLELKTGEKVLDVGTGSGWKAALIAEIVGESGRVVSVERIEELHNFSKVNMEKYENLKDRFILILGDGSKGYSDGAPYDKIIAGAAGEEIPEAWKEQLKIGGRIVAPVGNSIVVLDKVSKDNFEKKEYFGFSFVPLVTNN